MAGRLRPFEKPRLWLGIWVFGWALCITLSLLPPLHIGESIDNSDKIGHFLAYGTLSAWAVMIFSRRGTRLWAALSLVLLGVAMEFAQGALTDHRMMEVRDAVANLLGVMLGQCLALTPLQDLLLRVEKYWR